MTGEGDKDYHAALAEHRLARQGFHVTLDRGFDDGVYCVYVEFDDLAARIGHAGALRQAREYCKVLKGHLHCAGLSLGDTEDASYTASPRRRKDLELAYLTFPVFMADGRPRDTAVKKEFQLAVARADQQWDQYQARAATEKHDRQRNAFRQRLRRLLAGDTYSHLDGATRERLLADIPAVVFPPKGRGL